MRLWSILAGLLLMAGLIVPALRGPMQDQIHPVASGFVTNIYGQRLSWKGQLPITLHLHESVPDSYIPVLRQAMQQWQSAMGKPMFVLDTERIGGPKDSKGHKDGKNVVYVFKKGEWTGAENDQAKTYITWVGDQIHEADMVINADQMNFAVGSPQDPVLTSQIDLESVFVHELGHVLGLDHEDMRPSIMATYLKDGEERRQVFKADVAALQAEY